LSVSSDPRIGTELLGYRIEALLGHGGMAVVYRAEDLRLKRKVALKLLAPQLAEDARFRERFLRESELAASIDHPHVIPIYEAGEADGLLYIAMRYVEGSDLKRLLEAEGPLDPRRALALLGQAADALDAAHARGLVHRDVKPANILIAGEEQVYLADFGLTKQSSSERALTETDQFLGTGDYMAPEQIERRPLDGRADQYALGCVLYECLSGEVPYPGDQLMAVLWAHVNEQPPTLAAYRALDPVIAKALAKSPAARYSTCREFVGAARQALGEPAGPAPGRRRKLLPLAVLVVAAAAAVPSVLLTRGHGSSVTTAITADSLQRIDPRTEKLAATIRMGNEPTGVAVGEGSVWVINQGDETLAQIDPKGNTVTRTISLPKAPSAIAVGNGSVWMIQGTQGVPGPWLWRYDPSTRSFGAVSDVNLVPLSLAVGAGAVWVEDFAHQPDVLVRIHPASGRSLGSVPGCPCGAPVFGEGSAWASAGDGIHNWIYRLDPKTKRILARVALSFNPGSSHGYKYEIAAGEGGIWVGNSLADSVIRIDPSTNRLAGTFPTGRTPAAVAVGAGAVWVANSRDGTVTRYEPKTADISTIKVGGTPVDLAVGEGGVWVVTQAR
jgi:YVTN family beta-propeller protein